ncbi:MAG TPA: DsbA family oxidoreductase [Candidatus Thermoplasmatota archaeon]|nr:DsbA family oxidoreductase [Candidatus Thermoplasmatota archaeon]
MKVDVWSDIACPWCWLGKAHLEEAARRAGVPIEVEFHAFELQPGAQRVRPLSEYARERFGDPRALDAAHARLAAAGARVGLAYDFGRALMASTFDAHRLHALAKERGLGGPLVERLMRARQGEGADVSDHVTLRALALEAGLAAAEVDRVLASDAYADRVRADERAAVEIGVSGVPFFVFDDKLALGGAQPVEVFERALAAAAAAGMA